MSEIPLQQRVQPWMMVCFGPAISADKQERNHRLLKEALELVQACGATQEEAHQLANDFMNVRRSLTGSRRCDNHLLGSVLGQ